MKSDWPLEMNHLGQRWCEALGLPFIFWNESSTLFFNNKSLGMRMWGRGLGWLGCTSIFLIIWGWLTSSKQACTPMLKILKELAKFIWLQITHYDFWINVFRENGILAIFWCALFQMGVKLVDLTTRWVWNFVNEHLKTVLLNIMMMHRPWIGALDPRVLSRKKIN
jgi:hypothetical protein